MSPRQGFFFVFGSFLFVALFGLMVSARAVETTPSEVLDRYECVGTNVYGKYEITLQIQRRDDNYLLIWHDGVVRARGMGIRVNNVLSAVLLETTGQVGVIHFQIAESRLDGLWAMGSGRVFTEVCASTRPRDA